MIYMYLSQLDISANFYDYPGTGKGPPPPPRGTIPGFSNGSKGNPFN